MDALNFFLGFVIVFFVFVVFMAFRDDEKRAERFKRGQIDSGPSPIDDEEAETKKSGAAKLTPLKFATAAEIAQKVGSEADLDPLIKFGHLLGSDQEKRKVLNEINEDLRSKYLEALCKAYEVPEIEEKLYMSKPEFRSELERCVDLGAKQIMHDERVAKLFSGVQEEPHSGIKIEKGKSWDEIKNEL